ncbi:MAG: UPF0149 family protein [Gammaproteobacteria bacterium]|nr:UPF0149 family protein [Gammaproteobacteria bacterium]
MNTEINDYDELNTVMRAAGCSVEPAEAHGMLCGLLLGDKDQAVWMMELFEDDIESGDLSQKTCVRMLASLYEQTRQQLNDSGVELTLLLVDEDDDLADKTFSLSKWVQGYLYGVGLSGVDIEAIGSEDATELLQDFSAISQARFEEDDEVDEEESEAAYTEVFEYVRVATLLLQEELNPLKAVDAPTLGKRVH